MICLFYFIYCESKSKENILQLLQMVTVTKKIRERWWAFTIHQECDTTWMVKVLNHIISANCDGEGGSALFRGEEYDDYGLIHTPNMDRYLKEWKFK